MFGGSVENGGSGYGSAVVEHPDDNPAEQPNPLRNDRQKPVAVTGAAGFVGTHLCRELVRAGWKVHALVRNPEKATARLAHLPVQLKVGDLRDAEFVKSALEGAGAVVHLAAIAIERPGQSYEQVNTHATEILLNAAQAAGIDRFLHMSQNGSDSKSPYRFLRSKGVAQDMVTSSTMRWTVFRPSVIFGPEDEFVNVLARLVRLTPFVFPLPGGGGARFQPIYVDDVATAIRVALDNDATIGKMYPLGGPVPLTLRQMTERILTAMQTRRALVGLPIPVLRPLVAVMERLLPNPPVTSSLLDILKIDNTVPENTITTTFGVTPTPFAPEELHYLRRITTKDAIKALLGK
jgi:uncharacterized protein YbjT (DUF2867 family)